MFKVLLQHGSADLELKNADGYTVLWLALQEVSALPLLRPIFLTLKWYHLLISVRTLLCLKSLYNIVVLIYLLNIFVLASAFVVC